MKEVIKYIPAIFFFITWLSLLTQGESIKEAVKYPLNKNVFIQNMGSAIDNPWSHNTALRIYFKKLMQDKASPRLWENSRPFANAIWQQYQYDGSIEIMFAIAHASNNNLDELYWATIYDKLHGNRKLPFLKHAQEGHAKGEILELSGQW